MKNINLLLPKNGIVLSEKELDSRSIYFLAGPILGGGDWQKIAIKMLAEKDPECYIVCPCRYDNNHELYKHNILSTNKNLQNEILEFENQTHWERYYMQLAAKYGSLIFWLPCEDKNHPRPKEFGPYARDTYGEIGRWSIIYSQNQTAYDITIGAESEFSGLSVIKKNWQADNQKNIDYLGRILEAPATIFYNTLEDTITAAITKLHDTTHRKLRSFARAHNL